MPARHLAGLQGRAGGSAVVRYAPAVPYAALCTILEFTARSRKQTHFVLDSFRALFDATPAYRAPVHEQFESLPEVTTAARN